MGKNALLYVARLTFCCSTSVVVLASFETLINVRMTGRRHVLRMILILLIDEQST